MKYTATLLAASVLAAGATPAFAQSTNEAFTGPRVEVLAGFDASKAGSDIDDDTNDNNDQSIEGLVYGAGVGYDIALGSILVGAEAELTGSTAETEFDDGDFEGFGFGNVETGRDLYVGLRAGVLASPNLLVYAKGGYTNAKYNILSNDGTNDFNQDIDTDGYRIGAGAEYALSENTFAKLEYRYSNYSKAELDFADDIPDSERFDIDTDRHQVVLGVGYRF